MYLLWLRVKRKIMMQGNHDSEPMIQCSEEKYKYVHFIPVQPLRLAYSNQLDSAVTEGTFTLLYIHV